MKLRYRILSCLLLIAILSSMLPLDVLSVINAEDMTNPITQGNSGSLENGGKVNPQGGVKTASGAEYRPTFRVSVVRDKDAYNNGTQEVSTILKENFKFRQPTIATTSESLFFQAYGIDMKSNPGIGLYESSGRSLLWSTSNAIQSLIVQLNSSPSNPASLNKAKQLIKNAGYGTKEKPLSSMKQNEWKTYADSISSADAKQLWSYVLGKVGSGYEVNTRLSKVISDNIKDGMGDLSTLSFEEQQDIVIGYVGVLMTLYKLADSQGANLQLSQYSSAIVDYIENKNVVDKPVAIIIDTAVPMVFNNMGPTPVYLNIPSIDYLEYVALTPSHASIKDDATGQFVKNNLSLKGKTKQQIIAGAAESLKINPLSETKDGNGIYRVADYAPSSHTSRTAHQKSILTDPFCWGGVIPGWVKERLIVGRGNAEFYYFSKSSTNAAFMEMVEFDGDTRGFIISSLHLAQDNIGALYKVDSAIKSMAEQPCDPIARIMEPNVITFTVKAESSTISTLSARMVNGDPDVSMEVTGKMFRERYKNGVLDQAEQEVPALSQAISIKRSNSELIEFLQGTPQILHDTTIIGEEFERNIEGNETITYKYYIKELVVKYSEELKYEFKWEDIVARDGETALNYAEHVMSAYIIPGAPVPHIEIPKPNGTTDLNLLDPSVNEHGVDSVMINTYDFTTGGYNFAEVKSNTPGSEKYEVMAGIPSTEEIYFSAGGSEYRLAIVLQYWMNEKGVDRTYRSYFTGTSCEYKSADDAKTGSIGGHTVALHGGGSYTKTWTGSIPNKAVAVTNLHNATCTAIPDRTAYDAAKKEAEAYIKEVNDTTLTYTSGSDKFTRSQTGWSAHISTDAPVDPQTTSDSKTCSYKAPSGTPPSGGVACGNEMATANPGPAGNYTITVTFTVPAHIICGPCCTHELPLVEDTWKQGVVFDFVKISQIRLFKIDQASVTGMEELIGTDEIFINIKSGDPTYFLNIAQLNAKADPIIPDYTTSINDFGSHRNTLYSNGQENRAKAQSSKFGRLRYSVEPQQHDVVVWNEGVRTNKCDGLAPTKNNSATISKAVAGNGHGDDQPWSVGTLYTNKSYSEIYNHHMQRDGLRNKTAYSDKADDRDIQTVEWKKFDERRRKENIVTVISDFLILQTSGGDQSIFYFAKQSEPAESQEHFQKVKSTEEEMFTENAFSIFYAKKADCATYGAGEGNSRVKVSEDFINIGSYNGLFKNITGKYTPYNIVENRLLSVNSPTVPTVLDSDPAGTVKRPQRNGKLMMYEDKIQILPTAENKVYTPKDSTIFYKQVLGYYSNDLDRVDTTGQKVGPLNNVGIGMESWKQMGNNLVKWGDQMGLQYATSYSSNVKDHINSVIVYTPVTTERATILPLDDININGERVSRDQRVDDVIVDLNEEINKFKICPLDPSLCEFRHLNCKYLQDTKLAEFDFESTYKVKEKKNLNGLIQNVEVTKNNTYQSGGKWVTTNKVTGIEYTLPTGFTVGNGKVGNGNHLNAFGTRWSIPFSDLGLTSDKSNKVAIKMDFYMDTNSSNKSMLVSFWGYDFWLNPNNGSDLGVFNTGDGLQGKAGAGIVKGNGLNRKINVELVFGFNNVMDCEAYINGVPVNVQVRKTDTVWKTVGGVRKLVEEIVDVNNFSDIPENITKNYIGNSINIGSWGRNDLYPANFYIDNLEIWLKGGTHEHNSSCYTNVKICETAKIHVHDAKCYTTTDSYTNCNESLNTNYQHGASSPLNYYGSPACGYANGGTTCGLTETGTGVYNLVKSDDDSGGSLEAYISYSLTKGQSIKIQMGGYNGGGGSATLTTSGPGYYHNSGQRSYSGYFEGSGSYIHEFVVETSGTYTFETSNRTNDPYLGLYVRSGHRHVTSCYHYHTGSAGTTASGCYSKLNTHRHSGTAGGSSASGCYTVPTGHTHTTSCGFIKSGTLQCTGELNTVSDLNYHRHSSDCLITAVALPTVKFNYTGDAQTYIASTDGYYVVKAWGASGGGSAYQYEPSHRGLGGYTEGRIYMKKGERLYIYVGGEGKTSTALNTGGGWNGGGHGGPNGFGGGGATDIRLVKGATWSDERALFSRIMVAAGGGGSDNLGGTLGSTEDGSGGSGGNLIGENGKINGSYSANTGATQNSGFAFGLGGSATTSTDTGGGGGGYYGGKATNNSNGGAGGGSSYISGHSGVNSIDMNGVHTNEVRHFSGRVFTNTKMERGLNKGNGRVEIIPENVSAGTLLDDIVKGNTPLSEMEDYLGKELMGKLWGTEKLMFTWSNWTSSNMKGFNPNTTGVGSTISAVNGNLKIVQNTSNYELKVPVDIPKGLISKIEIVLDNNTSATSGKLSTSLGINTYPGTSSGTVFTMAANTNNQTITIEPNRDWVEIVKAFWFDIGSGAKFTGDISIKSIKLYGYGTVLAGTGEVQTVIVKTPEQSTESTVSPKYVKKTVTTRYTNGVAGSPSTLEEEVASIGTASSSTNTISTRTKVVSSGQAWTYSTASSHSWSVPATGNYTLEVWGAEGGTSGYGGKGGYSKGIISLTSGQLVYIYVGGQTGFNGGGSGNQTQDSGGGGTDIRVGGTALSNRKIVAGGGGGYGGRNTLLGGDGGGLVGQDGQGGYSSRQPGLGGTQTSGGSGGSGSSRGGSGSLGQGGNQLAGSSDSAGGGGGGGYYGGGAGGNDYPDYDDRDDGSGGGGSGYIGGVTSGTMQSGVRSGNGRAVITSLQDIYSGNDVYDKIDITYYETTKTVSTPKTVVKETTKTTFEPLKVNFAATQTEFTNFGSYTFKAPSDGWYAFQAWGASGNYPDTNTVSGKGGYTYGEIYLSKNETVYVYVGERGNGNSEANPSYTFNGGGFSGTVHASIGGRGGGATDFRLSTGNWDDITGLRSRIMVAGGGGGKGCAFSPLIEGHAGGLLGSDTLNGGTTYYGYVAKGGTQTGSSVGHRNGNTISAAFTGVGSFGKGGIGAQCGAGGGGGYYGGGTTYTAGGAGGSSYISGFAGVNSINASGTHTGSVNHFSGKSFRNTVMKAGYEVMPATNGNTEIGHSGNGYARITFIPDKPEGEPIRKTILDNVDLIPDFLPNGTRNPLFLCKGIPYNEHRHTENCRTLNILNCTEPHHSGEHYDGSNRICWEPCGDDSNHKIGIKEVEVEPGVFTQNAKFLQIDHEFTVYFPNKGDFYGNNALGLSKLQSQTGYGYKNNTDTTNWTREKRVKFPFNVIHEGEMYLANTWINLKVTQEYFDFYMVLANKEASNASVEFEVEAINNGVVNSPSLKYRAAVSTEYANALKAFKASLQPRFITALQGGYRTNRDSVQGYQAYFTWKQGEETSKLTKAIQNTKKNIWSDFNGGTGPNATHNNVASSINQKAKPLTVNDNRRRESNILRNSSLESLHGGYKYFYLDVLGRIGNFAIVDTEDYRFSNLFKLPLTDPPEWLIEGFIYKVEEAVQQYYFGDEWDIRGNKISTHTKWLNTYGTQSWMQGTPQSLRNVNNPNIVGQVLTADSNNIEQLKKEQLRFGYDIYTSINTIGSYEKGRVLVTPYYYALNLETGDITPVDVYISKDGVYEAVNIYNNSTNGEYDAPVYKYNMNLDWTTESDRRSYLGQERTETLRVAEHFKNVLWDYSPYGEDNIPPDDFEPAYAGTETYRIPSGAYNYLGDAQSMLLNSSHRTFIGSEVSNGNSAENNKWGLDKNPGDKINEVVYSKSAQRWHFKIGIPSSSVFVMFGDEPTQENIDLIMDDEKYAIIATASIIGIGSTWDIEYTQPWLNSIRVDGKNFDVSRANLPPIIAIFASSKSSVNDVGIVKTH